MCGSRPGCFHLVGSGEYKEPLKDKEGLKIKVHYLLCFEPRGCLLAVMWKPHESSSRGDHHSFSGWVVLFLSGEKTVRLP